MIVNELVVAAAAICGGAHSTTGFHEKNILTETANERADRRGNINGVIIVARVQGRNLRKNVNRVFTIVPQNDLDCG